MQPSSASSAAPIALSTRTPLSQIQMPAPKARISSVRSWTRTVQPAWASAAPMTSPVKPPPAISACRAMLSIASRAFYAAASVSVRKCGGIQRTWSSVP